MMGIARKNNGFLISDPDEKHRVAVHEIGHTFMALYRHVFKQEEETKDSEQVE